MICTRCAGEGFLNLEQINDADWQLIEATGDTFYAIKEWIDTHTDHDVQVCDCCGNGEDWHGEPGHHNYTPAGQEPYPDCA